MTKSVPGDNTSGNLTNLGPYYEAIIEAQIRSGKYPNAAEVLRDGLRLIEQSELAREIKLTQLRSMLDEADTNDTVFPSEHVRDYFKQRYEAMARKPA